MRSLGKVMRLSKTKYNVKGRGSSGGLLTYHVGDPGFNPLNWKIKPTNQYKKCLIYLIPL
jgi:hypothetical protein